MFSYIPFDWLIANECNIYFRYIESFSGSIYKFEELSKKLITSKLKQLIKYTDFDQYIPFSEITHVLFGDKHFVKGLLSIDQQKQLINFLFEYHHDDKYIWIKHPETMVEDVSQLFKISSLLMYMIKNQQGRITL
jgi:hypothetical protein